MKVHCKWLVALSLIIWSLTPTIVDGAAFSIPSRLIDMPVHNTFIPGQMDIGISSAYGHEANEADMYLHYALSDDVIVGFNAVRSNLLLGHIQKSVWNGKRTGLSVGILNVTSETSVSSWDGVEENSRNAMSSYVVTKMKRWGANWHLGYGSGRFRESVPKDDAKVIFGARGLFGGLDFNMLGGIVMTEFDGRDVNLGYRTMISPVTELSIAYTEAFNDGRLNENHTNTPVRFLTVGITVKNIFEHNRQLATKNMTQAKKEAKNKEVEALKAENQKMKDQLEAIWDRLDEIDDEGLKTQSLTNNVVVTVQVQLSDAGLRAVQDSALVSTTNLEPIALDEPELEDGGTLSNEAEEELPTDEMGDEDPVTPSETVAPEALGGLDTSLGEEVVKLYYESFDHYYKRDYLKAVDALTKAIDLQPNVAMLYIRLGTIYHELGLEREAMQEWSKALEIDPYNEEVKELMELYDVY